jgi:hypothetical protein
MLDNMKIVYVVSWMPSFEGASTGGFNWYPEADDAREWIAVQCRAEKGADWTHDYTLRSMLVPHHYSNTEVTDYLDGEMIAFRELPLPPEWAPIRDLGGAIDLTDKE